MRDFFFCILCVVFLFEFVCNSLSVDVMLIICGVCYVCFGFVVMMNVLKIVDVDLDMLKVVWYCFGFCVIIGIDESLNVVVFLIFVLVLKILNIFFLGVYLK